MKSKIQTGSILVSSPFSELTLNKHYQRSVVLVADYTEYSDTIGFILNKETDLEVNEALEDFPEIKSSLFFGGPIMTDTIHFLSTISFENSRDIKGVYWGGDLDELKNSIKRKESTKNNIRFLAGATLWAPGLLEEEIERGYWKVKSTDPKLLFNKSKIYEDWNKAYNYITGSKYGNYNFMTEPSLN